VDDDIKTHGKTICGSPVVGTIEDIPEVLKNKYVQFICGVGSPVLRQKLVKRIESLPVTFRKFTEAIHSSVEMSDFVKIGSGSILCAGNIITTQVQIGRHVNLNIDCTVGHDCIIEDFVNISPGVHISGYCTLKKGCDIGTGVNIIPHITIGEGAVIGAGACVTKDIPPYSLAVGVPAKVIKTIESSSLR
jgi:sugar O-acyltransferase (sialic acid O-acetyltransferase NeuD family)